MKNYLKALVLIAVSAMGLAGCQKDEVRNFYLGGKSPYLAASKTSVVLTPATEANQAIEFNWTNPDYQFSTGLSSQDVQYTLEFDVNSAFTSATKYSTSIAKELKKSFTVLELNNILGNSMVLEFGKEATVYARIKSALKYESATNAELISNVVSFKATPYAPPPAVEPPSSGKLVLVGSGSPGGWDNNASNPQVFTKRSNTLYDITINLVANGSVLFLPVAGSWDDKYGWDGANNANNVNGDNLRRGGGDIKVPATSGLYKITVNFQTGKFTITPQ
jgi:starch-binding outer membrane protein SusE/F